VCRCLFTNAELGPDTRIEHTIPRSLGGRIKSTLVTSSEFNQRSGRRLDEQLGAVYAEVMRALGPALPAEPRAGVVPVEVPGQEGDWHVNGFGQLAMSGAAVLDRDPATGHPQSAVGPDFASFRPMMHQLGATPVREVETLPATSEVIFPERATIHWRIEVAALKAILLSFDHLLRDDPERFTRSVALRDVRRFVKRIVGSDSEAPDVDMLADISLGVQYDQDLLDLYAKMLVESGVPATPFSHTLIVSANSATRTLDAVFWAFETDAHAFRLTKSWQDRGFTYVVNNGVLANTAVTSPVQIARTALLGRPTHRRCRMSVTNHLTSTERDTAAQQLSENRQELYRRAVDHVERNCDSHLQEQLRRLARLNRHSDHRLSTAVCNHIFTLFEGKTQANKAADRFIELVSPIVDGTAYDVLTEASTSVEPARGWGYWLQIYRDCLDAVRDEFGLPGHIFEINRTAEAHLA